MMKYIYIALALIISALSGYSYTLMLKNDALKAHAVTLTAEITAHKTKVKTQQAQIQALTKNAAYNQKLQVGLIEKISSTKNEINQHQIIIRRLERENAEVKAWANNAMPNSIAIMRRRPTITGSGDYQKWLSERNKMHPARDKPPDK